MLLTLAAIADLIAAAGVIGSRLFLTQQLRAQNHETGLNNWREFLETLTDYKGITNDPRMANLVTCGHADCAALIRAEKLAFGLHIAKGSHIIGRVDKHSGTVLQQMKDVNPSAPNWMLGHINSPGARGPGGPRPSPKDGLCPTRRPASTVFYPVIGPRLARTLRHC